MVEVKTDTPSFTSLGLSKWLATNLTNVGIAAPTGIQQRTIPLTVKGHNIIGCAHTGSGKTACFATPILEKLAKDPYGIFALVLTPTRELAYQIGEQFRAFSAGNLNLKCAVLTGGIDVMRQAAELTEIPHVIVATPGRLSQLLELDQYQLNEYLDNLQFLVMDEADRMLTDPTIQEHMSLVLAALSRRQEQRRQTLLYSATMAKNYTQLYTKEQIFGKFIKEDDFDIKEVGNDEEADTNFKMTVSNLEQKFALVPANVKEAYLISTLNATKLKKSQQMIVFTSTCRNCHFLAMLCQELGF